MSRVCWNACQPWAEGQQLELRRLKHAAGHSDASWCMRCACIVAATQPRRILSNAVLPLMSLGACSSLQDLCSSFLLSFLVTTVA